MARAPFQVLVFPYRQQAFHDIQYAIFSRADSACWQGIAGGGEDAETPLQAAQRESFEEAGIADSCPFLQLETINPIPVIHFKDSHRWGEATYIIPEYTFGVNIGTADIKVSGEHRAYRWLGFEEATGVLAYEGNRTALWELNQKVLGKGPRD